MAQRRHLLAASLGLGLAAPRLGLAAWPEKPIRLVIPFPAGGATDAVGRLLAQHLAPLLNTAVVVENRSGGGGAVGADAVAKAPADGHTLLMGTVSTHAVIPALNPRTNYDAVREFAPIGQICTAPNVLVASPALPVNNVAQLIDWAKARNGQVNYASSGIGAVTHLIGELFKLRAGIVADHVPYRAGVQAVPDMLESRIHYLFDSVIWTLPLVREGRIKGLAVASPRRSALAPDLPTVAEAGLPGFVGETWFALYAPAGTPGEAVARLAQATATVVRLPEAVAGMARFGAEAAPEVSPAALARLQAADTAKWAEVIRSAGIKPE